MNDFLNPQLSNLQTQLQQIQSLMGKTPPAVPASPPHTIPEVDGIEGVRQFQKTMPPNSKDAVFDKVEPVFFALAVDANGIPQPIKRCPYTMEDVPEPGSDTITRKDFEAFEEKVMGLIASMAPKKATVKKEAADE